MLQIYYYHLYSSFIVHLRTQLTNLYCQIISCLICIRPFSIVSLLWQGEYACTPFFRGCCRQRCLRRPNWDTKGAPQGCGWAWIASWVWSFEDVSVAVRVSFFVCFDILLRLKQGTILLEVIFMSSKAKTFKRFFGVFKLYFQIYSKWCWKLLNATFLSTGKCALEVVCTFFSFQFLF